MWKELALHERLREARERKRLTQPEAAEAVGVNRDTLSKAERGAIIPSVALLLKLADLYEVSPYHLVYRGGPHDDVARALRPVERPDADPSVEPFWDALSAGSLTREIAEPYLVRRIAKLERQGVIEFHLAVRDDARRAFVLFHMLLSREINTSRLTREQGDALDGFLLSQIVADLCCETARTPDATMVSTEAFLRTLQDLTVTTLASFHRAGRRVVPRAKGVRDVRVFVSAVMQRALDVLDIRPGDDDDTVDKDTAFA